MRPLAAIGLGIVAYGTFLALQVPASFLADRIGAASGNRAAFTRVEGGMFSGRGTVTVAAPSGSAIVVDEVQWRWVASDLFAGRLSFDVDARMGALAIHSRVARTPGKWQLRDLQAEGDASALSPLHPLLSAWQPSGTIAIASPLISSDGTTVSGTATADWNDAHLALSDVRPLGSWHAMLSADASPVTISLATTRGPLHLSGRGTLAIPGRLAFSGEASTDPGREKELEPLLKLLGNRRADGAFAIELR